MQENKLVLVHLVGLNLVTEMLLKVSDSTIQVFEASGGLESSGLHGGNSGICARFRLREEEVKRQICNDRVQHQCRVK